jgi:CRP-like cAMP-binding protein
MRLISLVERIEELSLVNAGSRLARYLLHQPGHGPSASVQIDLPMSKKDLAAHLSMSPETLSRLLRRWQDLRWIDSDRASVTVLAPQRLLALADGEEPGPRS